MQAHKLITRLDTPGTTALWKVFWLHGVLVSHLLFGTILLLYQAIDSTSLALLLLGFIGYTAWLLNAVWRNAGNVREAIYGEMARFLTVAWSINAVLVSAFLLLAHLQPPGQGLPF
ncbi:MULTISPECIES: hypothetical protein [unclassified Pseudomonas]|uniref:hypothetical protein n=1 Tax=unclassified Pseudomonas TaxID=196821 RepID=UPI002447E709|nr:MULTISPECIES: hypothetical protein [unclassified Pseudomonas]MDG9926814.1 hypothetical protein [Pseudomonas sp. GD04042]MDH0484380.1 hypothetical protein [Pseudomonas sp. GD04015]MDH0606596.1 hypothetical protein [Pseudomonas sp. GD03869]